MKKKYKIIPGLLGIGLLFFFYNACSEEHQENFAKKKCNEIPCSEKECFFWNNDKKRCVTDEGLKKIYEHENNKDSIDFYAYLQKKIEEQIRYAVKMCGENNEWPLDSLKFLLKKAKISEKNIMKIDSSKSKAVLQNDLQLFCSDVLLKKLEHQKIEIMNEIRENVSAYKIYVEKD